MITEHKINSLNNFICGWYQSDNTICDNLIDYLENNPDKSPGECGKNKIDKSYKDSIDVMLNDNKLQEDYYLHYLQPITDLYRKKYHYCDYYEKWSLIENGNVQKYSPGGGFHSWHCERATAKRPMSQRHLVYMTYLNDICDAGETEFFYQKIKVKPEKGLTLIWPADWCFTHRGITSMTETKYIMTGWYSYIDE